jgi:RND family efflux transporter MFP subunit
LSALPKTKLYTLIVLVVGLALGITILKSKPQPEPKDVPVAKAPVVSVLTVRPSQQSLQVKTQGTIQPRREIDLVAQVSGKVVSVADNFADGGFFEQGTTLVNIEDSDYRFALSRAEAKVAEAEQLLATEKGRARQAKREWRELGNREANALFLRKPQLAAAQAGLNAAKADRDQAQLNLERTQVSTPFKGRLRETAVDLGQYVNAGARVARYYATDVVEVRLPLSDRQVALLDLPLGYQDADQTVHPDVVVNAVFAGKNWQWSGKIKRTDASIDVESRMVYAVAEIAHPFEVAEGSDRPPLSIGQFIQAQINGKAFNNMLLLPRAALQADNKIWTLDKDNRLQLMTVNILQAGSNKVAVQLETNQPVRVVVSIMPVAVVGMQVEPKPVTELAEMRQ